MMQRWSVCLLLASTLTSLGARADENLTAREDNIEIIEVDTHVTDTRGDDVVPRPREEPVICQSVVCGDEEPTTCTTCGKPAR